MVYSSHLPNKELKILTNITVLCVSPRQNLSISIIDFRSILDIARFTFCLRKVNCIIISVPKIHESAWCFLAKTFFSNIKLYYYDVLLPPRPQRVLEVLKRNILVRFLRKADIIMTVHCDTFEYSKHLRMPQNRFRYIGFKSNSWENTDARRYGYMTRKRQTHILSCGQSYRDIPTFLQAMALCGLPAKVLIPIGSSMKDHGTAPCDSAIPPNVTVIRHDGTQEGWLSALLAASIVVVPLRRDVLQPAGISVYLEAMNLSRPVIISDSPATRGLLDDTIASVVPAADPAALAAETRKLWCDHDLRLRRIENAHTYVDRLGGTERLSRDILGCCLEDSYRPVGGTHAA